MTRLGAAGDVPDLTVVIPTVDRVDGRIASLASIIPLVESDDLHAEIIIAEQGTETSRPRGELHDCVTWLFSTHRGVSHARNAGLARARASAIIFVDDDAIVEPGLVRLLREHTAAGRIVSAGAVAFGHAEKRRRAPTDTVPLTALNTNRFMLESGVIFDTEALRRAGGFDERIGQPTARGAEEGAAAVGAVAIDTQRRRLDPSATIIASPITTVSHPAVSTPPLEKAWRYGCGAGSLIWLQPSRWTLQYTLWIGFRRLGGLVTGVVGGDRQYQRIRWSWLRGFAAGLWSSGRQVRASPRRGPDTYRDITDLRNI